MAKTAHGGRPDTTLEASRRARAKAIDSLETVAGLLKDPTGDDKGGTFEESSAKVRAARERLEAWEEPANLPHEQVPSGLLTALVEARDALNHAADRLVEATPNAIARGAAAELDSYAWNGQP